MDHHRVPHLSPAVRRGPTSARSRPGGPGRPAAIGIGLLLMAGCVTNAPTPSAVHPTSPLAASPTTGEGPGVEPSTPASSPTPIPNPDDPPAVPLRSITILCESWGAEPPPTTVDCGGAIIGSLAALGAGRAAVVRRVDFGYGEWCDDAPACPTREPDIGWVVARSATLETLLVRVARDATGGLQAWPPVPGPRVIVPIFHAPPVKAPDVGAGAPRELAQREAFPFCGSENLGLSDAFNTAARQCFLEGVRAGSPVELISRTGATEGGGDLLNVYRFTGEGAIFRYLQRDGRWSVSACGISPIATTAAFVLAGHCDQQPL